MPKLTRRRYPERQDCWNIYFGDVHVGTIAKCVGNPGAAERWQWMCGFYPGSKPGEQTNGTADDLRPSARRLRGRMAEVFGEADGSRLSGMARSPRLDGTQVRYVGTW